MADETPVTYHVDNGVATITLDRPEGMNGLTIATKEALLAAVTAAAEDTAVRAVVLTGTGRAFCVGQDLKEHIALLENGGSDELFTTVEKHYNPIVTAIATMSKPVIAAVNGVAAGAGASLAFACDLRLLAESAGFNLAFPGVALSCDTGASWTLPRLVGQAKALELFYFPSTIGSADALALGLATRVVPDADLAAEAAALAAKLAAGPTLSYASIRQSVNYSASHSFEESLAYEGSKMTLTGASDDHRRAVTAFVTKTKATFTGS
ncbi:MAG: enoyl-CoA hydratase-related protein [Propionibacteriales bacterium]|nr:enoyl-CoA hydratase-related protein [Propionibacteriales bacterium]